MEPTVYWADSSRKKWFSSVLPFKRQSEARRRWNSRKKNEIWQRIHSRCNISAVASVVPYCLDSDGCAVRLPVIDNVNTTELWRRVGLRGLANCHVSYRPAEHDTRRSDTHSSPPHFEMTFLLSHAGLLSPLCIPIMFSFMILGNKDHMTQCGSRHLISRDKQRSWRGVWYEANNQTVSAEEERSQSGRSVTQRGLIWDTWPLGSVFVFRTATKWLPDQPNIHAPCVEVCVFTPNKITEKGDHWQVIKKIADWLEANVVRGKHRRHCSVGISGRGESRDWSSTAPDLTLTLDDPRHFSGTTPTSRVCVD